jgi:hypothetical protein
MVVEEIVACTSLNRRVAPVLIAFELGIEQQKGIGFRRSAPNIERMAPKVFCTAEVDAAVQLEDRVRDDRCGEFFQQQSAAAA